MNKGFSSEEVEWQIFRYNHRPKTKKELEEY